MYRVEAPCDRCRQPLLDCWRAPGEFTAGYYERPKVIIPGSGWPEAFRDGEQRICDKCMWADPVYIRIYGHVGGTDR